MFKFPYLGLGHPATAAAAASEECEDGGEGEDDDDHHDGDQPRLREASWYRSVGSGEKSKGRLIIQLGSDNMKLVEIQILQIQT